MPAEKNDNEIRERMEAKKVEEKLKEEKRKILKEQEKEGIKNKQKLRKIMEKRNRKKFWVRYENELTIVFFVCFLGLILYFKFFGDGEDLSNYKINDEEYIRSRTDEIRDFEIGVNPYFSDKTLLNADKMANTYLNNLTLDNCDSDENLEIRDLPESFDFREKNKECSQSVMKQKIDQSISYLNMVFSSLREKLCLKKEKFNPSFDFMINCDKKKNKGYKGGLASASLKYMIDNGVIEEGCISEFKDKCPSEEEINKCKKLNISKQCLVKGKEFIKKEIFTNGSVMGMIPYFRDFLLYKNGIFYTDVESTKIEGQQIVKIVGWNKNKEGIEYWIVENSFGVEYGVNGYLHIHINNDEDFFNEVLTFRL